jgi:hypothetical protein
MAYLNLLVGTDDCAYDPAVDAKMQRLELHPGRGTMNQGQAKLTARVWVGERPESPKMLLESPVLVPYPLRLAGQLLPEFVA